MGQKESIREKARSIGFDLFGVAPARSAATAGFYARWIAAGRHGEMEYLSRRAREREDPRRLLPRARSIICVGMNYYTRAPEGAKEDRTRGRVARYAWGDDYHVVIGERLAGLEEFIRRTAGAETRSYVDTGPLLEREYAARAGIGWVGKSTNLIREGYGSWFLLGEILTDLELEADDPVADRCGTCRRCIDACPSGAIVEPYLLDSGACISYLTIEHRGPIPIEHRPAIGEHLFGCDICQDVCPWNGRVPETTEGAFRPRDGMPHPDLVSILEISEDAWAVLSRGSPIRRSRLRGVRRNAAVALGNSGDRSVVPALIRALGADDPLLRSHVAWALGRLGGRQAEEALRRALIEETDPSVRGEIEAALAPEVVR